MKLEAPLRLAWLKGIQAITGHRDMSNDRFFNKKIITVSSVGEDGKFSLYVNNPQDTLRYYSHEADRFASASFESLKFEPQVENNHRSTAWILIQSYYAAFFAAHSLMRVSGWSCTRLTGNNIGVVNKEISIFYPGACLPKGGMYLLRSSSNAVEITCEKLDAANSGGSHEALWSILRKFFNEMTTRILVQGEADDPNIQQIIQVLDDFMSFLDKKGGEAWLTKVRNNLNYSHQYGAWFPYKGSTCDALRIRTSLKNSSLEPRLIVPSLKSDELIQFAEACFFLVALCRASIKDLAYRSSAKSPFRQSSAKILSQLETKFLDA